MSVGIKLAEVNFIKGACIILEGKPNAGKFYLIKSGKVQITRESDKIISETNIAGPGEIFGVISVMASRSYIETVYAITDVTALSVDRTQIGKNPSLAMNIIKQFSKRLRELNEAYSKRVMNDAALGDPAHLLHIAVFYEKNGKSAHALYAYQQYLAYCSDKAKAEKIKLNIEKLKSRVTIVRPVYDVDTMIQKWQKGCLLFAEGEKGNNFYIIQEGAVKITKITDNNEVVLEVLKKGAILGEMAMIEDKPRGATAEIYEDSILMSVNKENFINLVNEQPDMAVRLISTIAERIWLRYRQLTNTLIENTAGRIYDALLIQLEKDRTDLTSTSPYTFNFDFRELIGMAGIPENNAKELFNKLTSARRIAEFKGKLSVLNISGVIKEADYYRRARQLGKDVRN